MAAEACLGAGLSVHLFEAKGSVGRKFLLAGKGGLNLTHSEDGERFLTRFGATRPMVEPWLREFDAAALREWARELGVETVVGSSGRVFPKDFKAAPLLRSWLRRLRAEGLQVHVHHRWRGWVDGALVFESPDGEPRVTARRSILALGGGSWPVLGSDGAWVPLLESAGAQVTPLRASNVGYTVEWSDLFRQRFAGEPIKPVALRVPGGAWRQGELLVADYGLEGSLVYAQGQALAGAADESGVDVELDLIPGGDSRRTREALRAPRNGRSLSEVLRRRLGLAGVRAALLRECLDQASLADPATLAARIHQLPLRLGLPRPMAEAISTAGGVAAESLSTECALQARPDVFCAGEMLDWDAPTGGYLLTACMASGRAAGIAARRSLGQDDGAA
ncbi:TIGR03862 family flavoprotein [Lysobacter sp. CAU 1642]|uniref:TIGR03862 family flavoprotein n=2 Tax=Pseudomarimonas salicorniae TaxID=2933270 RepID=A0ABT0GEX7_9GAMM|nr:TIGR03862 family flavoprotein [Lysobacter sp. CAU 1642]